MRALPPLLLLLAAAAAAVAHTRAPPPAAPAPRAALLVLRAACPAPLAHLFDEARLARYEPARSLLSARRPRLLTYEGERTELM